MNDPVPVTTEGDDEDQIDGCDVDPESTPAQVAGVDRFRQALGFQPA